MSHLNFVGSLPASKSLMNRALLVQSYFPTLEVVGQSECDDVKKMKQAVLDLQAHKEIDCGEAGTVLRFMALRASRQPGIWKLTGSPRLFQRPQEDLVFILDQLGVRCQLLTDSILIHSEGWKKSLIPISIHRERSSQFASAVLLNSWNLPFSLEFEFKGHGLSEGYWQMSVEMAKALGMIIEKKREHFNIPAKQVVKQTSYTVEIDYSSAFVVAAAAALGGQVEITNCNEHSFQPDYKFIEMLKAMGVPIALRGSSLQVSSVKEMRGREFHLADCPDLFPVLAVLCCFAKGESKLLGAPQLAHKESHRIEKTAELLKLAGALIEQKKDGLIIQGLPATWKPRPFVFDPDSDHRMAMAAAILRFRSFPVKVVKPEVVNKSFPEFWKILGFTS